MAKLLFIDTNIYLDFYRVRNDLPVTLLRGLDSLKDKILITDQIEMEFKKHRQAAILESFNTLRAPAKISRPPILSDHHSYKGLQNDIKRCGEKVKKLQQRLLKVFTDPVVNDPVYKVFQRIISKDDKLTLTRDHPKKNQYRRKALRRFLLGYPPRKSNDTSTGDAINWEWICEVCKELKADIIIVSRDSDYGVSFDGGSHINDWLATEFKDRVGKKRTVSLMSKLSDALKVFDQEVSASDIAAEEQLIQTLFSERRQTSPNEVNRYLQAIGYDSIRMLNADDDHLELSKLLNPSPPLEPKPQA